MKNHLMRAGAELVLALQSGLDALAENPTVAQAPGAGDVVARAADAMGLLSSLAETQVSSDRATEARARAKALEDIADAIRGEMRQVRGQVADDPEAVHRLVALAEVLSAVERQIGAARAAEEDALDRESDERAQ